jgi:hypothetical protein
MGTKRIDSITHSLKPYNEDIFGIAGEAFWVLDGASALNQNHLTDHESDVFCVVNWWDRYLRAEINGCDRSIVEILEWGVEKINQDFSRYADVHALSKLDRVSSGIAVSRINQGRLECFVLGDVEINLQLKTQEWIRLTDDSIKALDGKVMELMEIDENREEKLVFKGFTQRELALLQSNRNRMNTEGGYYILEHDKDAIQHGIFRQYAVEEIESILLMTDGFAQLYQRYDLKEIFRLSKEKGLKRIVEKLREHEAADQEKKVYKRLKTHDDVTAILGTFE